MDINEAYEELIYPPNFIQNFKGDEFKEWVELGTKEDLKYALKEFEESECYEECQIIKDYIDNGF